MRHSIDIGACICDQNVNSRGHLGASVNVGGTARGVCVIMCEMWKAQPGGKPKFWGAMVTPSPSPHRNASVLLVMFRIQLSVFMEGIVTKG